MDKKETNKEIEVMELLLNDKLKVLFNSLSLLEKHNLIDEDCYNEILVKILKLNISKNEDEI